MGWFALYYANGMPIPKNKMYNDKLSSYDDKMSL